MNNPGLSRNEALTSGLAGYVEAAVLSAAQAAFIKTVISQGKNIVVTGSGGATGKTTFCNVLINEWSAQHPEGRMLVVEQVREITSTARNIHFQLEPQSMTAVEWRGIIEAYHPSAMTIGELRGGIAVKGLLGFWKNESRAGFATIYAGDPGKALAYLGQMLAEEVGRSDPALVVEAIDYVLHLEMVKPGKRVCREILTIDNYDASAKAFKLVPAA